MTNIKSEEIGPDWVMKVGADGIACRVPRDAPAQVGGIWSKYQPPAPEVILTPGGPDAPASSTVTVLNAEDIKRAAREAASDPVKEPAHYKSGGLEVIDVIEAFALRNALRAAVIKYILRADKKGATLQDLKKARQYLSREIAALEGRRGWE